MLTKIFAMQIVDDIKDYMQKNVANFGLVPEKIFNRRLMEKINNHKQIVKSGKKGTASPCIILELMLASLFSSIQLQCTRAFWICRQTGISTF